MDYILTILKEAIVVGILTVIIGYLVSFIVAKIYAMNLPKICKEWNKNYIMEICLFFTGFFIHVFCEFTGINKWYCKNGGAVIYK